MSSESPVTEAGQSNANVRRALGWSLAGRYVNMAVGLGSSMIIARMLTPAEIGLFSMCAAAMLVAGNLRDFGVSDYLIQEKNLSQEKVRGAFAFALICAWIVGTGVYFARPVLAGWYNEPKIESLIAIQTIAFFVLPISSPAYALLHRELAFGKVFIADFCATMAGATVAIGLASRGHGPHSLAWGAVASIAAQTVAVTLLRPRSSLFWPAFGGTREIFRFGTYHVSARLLDGATNNAHEFIIARLFGFSAVGLFSRAKGAVDMFHTNVTTAITRVAMPALARAHRAQESLVERFAYGTAMFTGIAWPFFVFTAACAPELMLVLFGPQWIEAGNIARVLSIAMLPSGLYALSAAVFSAMGRVRTRFHLSLRWCPVHIAALFAASQFGFEYVAFAWWVSNCAIAYFFTRELHRLLKCSYRDMFAPCKRSVLVVVVVALPVLFTLEVLREQHWSSIATLASVSVVGLLAWVVGVRVTSHPAWNELSVLASTWRAARRA